MRKRRITVGRSKRQRARSRAGQGVWQAWRRDWDTLRSLRGKALLWQLWDYYRYRFLAVICVVIALCTAVHIIVEGQKPYRLRVCVVLNDDSVSCGSWFDEFEQALSADGAPGAVELNEDQPFDYDNMYYYVQEAEVMAQVSARRIDVAICGEDLYSYLLALNACMPLEEVLPEESDRLVYSTANLKLDAQGNTDPADGIDGYYALELTGTAFAAQYHQEDEGALYAVILSNTDHFEDSVTLLRALAAR